MNRLKHKASLLLLFVFVINWVSQDNNKLVKEPSHFSVMLQKEYWPLSKNKDSFTWALAAPDALWTWSSTQKFALFGRPCCIMTQPLLSQEETKVDNNQSRAWDESLPWDPTRVISVCDFYLQLIHQLTHTTLKVTGFLNSFKTSSSQASKISSNDLLLPTLLQVFLRYSEEEDTSQTEVMLILFSTYFHCIFFPSLETDSTLNFSMCSLPKQLISQLVQICQRNPEERTHPSKWILKEKAILMDNIKTSSLFDKHPSNLCNIKADMPVLTTLPFSPLSFKFQKN